MKKVFILFIVGVLVLVVLFIARDKWLYWHDNINCLHEGGVVGFMPYPKKFWIEEQRFKLVDNNHCCKGLSVRLEKGLADVGYCQ